MEERIEVRKPSVIPYYSVGLFWLLYAMLFPMLRLFDFILVTVLSIVLFIGLKKVCKPKIEVTYRMRTTGDTRLDSMISEGMAFLKTIRQSRDFIDNKAIQESIDRIDHSTMKILEHVRAYPNKLSSIRRFMNYYLPTIAKLLKSYDTLEEQNLSASSIQNTMQGIEHVMSKAADAFDHQLEALFASDIVDIDSEIKVLEHMMKRQGLFQSEFETIMKNGKTK